MVHKEVVTDLVRMGIAEQVIVNIKVSIEIFKIKDVEDKNVQDTVIIIQIAI